MPREHGRRAMRPALARYLVFAALLALGIAFVALGVFRGELPVVWAKAASVCFQCIGIG